MLYAKRYEYNEVSIWRTTLIMAWNTVSAITCSALIVLNRTSGVREAEAFRMVCAATRREGLPRPPPNGERGCDRGGDIYIYIERERVSDGGIVPCISNHSFSVDLILSLLYS